MQAIAHRHAEEIKDGGSVYILKAEKQGAKVLYTYIVDNGYGRITTYTLLRDKPEVMKTYQKVGEIPIYVGKSSLQEVQKRWNESRKRGHREGSITQYRTMYQQPEMVTKWSKRLINLKQYMEHYERLTDKERGYKRIPNYDGYRLDKEHYEVVIRTTKGDEYRFGLAYGMHMKKGRSKELFRLQKMTSIADVQEHYSKSEHYKWLVELMYCYDLRKRVVE